MKSFGNKVIEIAFTLALVGTLLAIPMQLVVDKKTDKVLRWGYCNFATDGQFDKDNEVIIEKDHDFGTWSVADKDTKAFVWDSVSKTVKETTP